MQPERAALDRISELLETGALRVIVQQVLPLDQAAEAHRIGERGRNRGKLVLLVDDADRAVRTG